jgi:hypothetical protein
MIQTKGAQRAALMVLFLSLGYLIFEFVSNFKFRASDLKFYSLPAWENTKKTLFNDSGLHAVSKSKNHRLNQVRHSKVCPGNPGSEVL